MQLKMCLVLAVAVLTGCLAPEMPKPRSDVFITSQIGWWPYQEEMRVEEISAEVLKAPLNAANNRALIAIQLKGTVRYPKGGFLPFISEAHISERFRNEKGAQTGDILITPIVSVKEDPSYKGEPVPFDIKVQKILHTFQWGKNEYMIQSENRKTTLELFQKK